MFLPTEKAWCVLKLAELKSMFDFNSIDCEKIKICKKYDILQNYLYLSQYMEYKNVTPINKNLQASSTMLLLLVILEFGLQMPHFGR